MIIVHACTTVIVHACTVITVHACTIVIVHVLCPTGLMVGEIEGGGSGGKSPLGKQGLGGPIGSPMRGLHYILILADNAFLHIRSFYVTNLQFCLN